MAIITLGIMSKKLLLIPAYIGISFISMLVLNQFPKCCNYDLNSVEPEVGVTIMGFIVYFIFKPKQNKYTKKKRKIINIIILFVLKLLYCCYEVFYYYFIRDPSQFYSRSLINTMNGLELIFVTFATMIILKYKYYIHHIISLSIFTVAAVVNDILLGNYNIVQLDYLYIFIMLLINEVSFFSYAKYMMDELFYHYSEMLIIWGIFGTILKNLVYSCVIIYENKNGIDEILLGLKEYFSNANIYEIIFLQFIFFLIDRGIYFLFFFLILFYFKPGHLVMGFEFYSYIQYMISSENIKNIYFSIVLFIIQTLATLFYCEILEFNFYGLNANTVRNIQKREEEQDLLGRNSVHSEIELGDSYILRQKNSKGSDDELNNNDQHNEDLNTYEQEVLNQDHDLNENKFE